MLSEGDVSAKHTLRERTTYSIQGMLLSKLSLAIRTLVIGYHEHVLQEHFPAGSNWCS